MYARHAYYSTLTSNCACHMASLCILSCCVEACTDCDHTLSAVTYLLFSPSGSKQLNRMLNTVIMTNIANAKCSFSGNPCLKPSLIDHAKELPTITGDMPLCDKKRTQKLSYIWEVSCWSQFGISELMTFI